jgi:hypothetical protein
MKTILGWILVFFVLMFCFVNGLFMLISPRAWFRLPWWIRAEGSLTEQKYGRGWGAIEVRLTGAITVAAIVWLAYEILTALKIDG